MSDEQVPGIEASSVREHLSTHRTNDAMAMLQQNGLRSQRGLSERSSRLIGGYSQGIGEHKVQHEIDFSKKKTVIDSEDDTDQGTVEDDIFTLPEGVSFDDITEGDYSEDREDMMSEQIHTMGPGAMNILKAWANASEIERAVVQRKLRLVPMDTMEREVSHAFAMAMRDAAGVDHQALSDKKAADIAELRQRVADLKKENKELEFALSEAKETSAGRAMANSRITDSGASGTRVENEPSVPEPATDVVDDSATNDSAVEDPVVDDSVAEDPAPHDVKTLSDEELDESFGSDDDDAVDYESAPNEELPGEGEDDTPDDVPEIEPDENDVDLSQIDDDEIDVDD